MYNQMPPKKALNRISNQGGHFTPDKRGQFETEQVGHFKSELGGQYARNLQSDIITQFECIKYHTCH